jgi:hypothetical protein
VQRQIEIKVLEIVVPHPAQADSSRWIRFRHAPKVEQGKAMSNERGFDNGRIHFFVVAY